MPEKLVSPFRYENESDVKQRLDQTWLRFNGEVVWCRWYDDLKVVLTPVDRDRTKLDPGRGLVVHSSNEALDISSLRLGYFGGKINGYPMFVRRRPVRKFKQGVCLANMEFTCWVPGENGLSYPGESGTARDLTGSTGFSEMLCDNYLANDKALSYVINKTGPESVASAAISKDFCYVTHKGKVVLLDPQFEEVGVVDLGTRQLEVNDWWATPTMLDHLRMLHVSLKGG